MEEIALDIWEYAKHTVGMVGATILLLIVIAAVLLLQRAKMSNKPTTKKDCQTICNILGTISGVTLNNGKTEAEQPTGTATQQPQKQAGGDTCKRPKNHIPKGSPWSC